jgi:hypothetical protein
MLAIRAGGALKPAIGFSVKTGGVIARARTVKMMIGGVLTTIYTDPVPAMSAYCSPSEAAGFRYSKGAAVVTTQPVTAVVTGGTSPFLYSCTIVEFLGNAVSITSPGSATTTFKQTNYESTGSAIARWTVTDANGVVATCEVDLTFTHESSLSSPIL